jgi:hypothetical protein
MLSVQQGKDAPSPSSASKISAFNNEQAKRPIMNGRPIEKHGLPVHLFHPAFTRFQETFSDRNVVLNADDCAKAHTYLDVSAELYDWEPLRRKAILSSLGEAIGFDFFNDSDGCIVTPTADNHNAVAAFYELNNEVGTGGSDPAIRGALSFRKKWVTDEVRLHTLT